VLTLIWMIMTGGLFKIVSNWAVLTNTLIYQKICSHTGSISIYLVLIWKLESQQHFPKLSPEMISDVEHIYTQSG